MQQQTTTALLLVLGAFLSPEHAVALSGPAHPELQENWGKFQDYLEKKIKSANLPDHTKTLMQTVISSAAKVTNESLICVDLVPPTPAPTPAPTPSPCQKAKNCSVFGDPHISVFDQSSHLSHTEQSFVSLLEIPHDENSYEAGGLGDFWLVKSDNFGIQARYREVHYPKARLSGRFFMTALAVGGPLLNGRTLVVEPRAGKVTWNRQEILAASPSEFKDDVMMAQYHNQSAFVQNPKRRTFGIDVELPSCVNLVINRFKKHLGLTITMPRSAAGSSGVDGQCGNFNGDAEDDTASLIQVRAGRAEGYRVLAHESLFDL